MRNLYFIAIVPDSPVQDEVTAFKHDVSKRFGTKSALRSPAHITLFPPFHLELSEEARVIQALSAEVKGFHEFDIRLQGFDAFPPRVIFVKPGESTALRQLEKKVFHAMKNVGVERKSHHLDFHPHMTIGNRDWTEDQFSAAWDEYRHKNYLSSFHVNGIVVFRMDQHWWKSLQFIHF